jgi:hypothetical protein
MGARVVVFNALFNNISAILWWSVLLVEESVPITTDVVSVNPAHDEVYSI